MPTSKLIRFLCSQGVEDTELRLAHSRALSGRGMLDGRRNPSSIVDMMSVYASVTIFATHELILWSAMKLGNRVGVDHVK
jgi:hypothetical protein